MTDIIVIGIIILLVIGVSYYIRKQRKSGKTSCCSGDCSGCSGSCSGNK
ncbi:MAG: FeoB-associated Cys-rich membrane protein [Mobilitalea sp.]